MKSKVVKLTREDNCYKLIVTLPLSTPHQEITKLQALASTDKLKDIKVSPSRVKRSLDANAALWLLLDKLAIKLMTTKEELYSHFLIKYGVSDVVQMLESAKEDFINRAGFRAYQELDKKESKGKTTVYLACYYGSSTYDKKEFARLLDGVIEEAKEQDIDFISKEERDLLIKEWK